MKPSQLVKKHHTQKDTHAIWEEVCKFYDNSITTSINTDSVLSYLVDVKLHKASWNRGQGQFMILNKSQVRKFNQIAPESKISDGQPVGMLQNVMRGTPDLAPVLTQYHQESSWKHHQGFSP